ncbi:hypothetical protein [Actinomadura rudentiformis]|uniref:Uncharacterized protein n=1 Tax=Actinomadura rudentiformis TaxID=359158 RepID=A0A6H9YPS1_9ACTN|nr:hypothetical protein [Actinomadura rudentiformis]KAB2345590.1 hypothetical protein F8566_26990 [Actinomadura rudentiformis]
MSGDQGPDAHAPRPRPDFLPPADEYPPPAAQNAAQDAAQAPGGRPAPAAPPSGSDSAGTWWNILVVCAASALLVAAFLPWIRARVIVDAFGQTLTHDLGERAGIDADSMVLALPVLALTAVGMALWGIAARDTRISSLTAVPGALALLVCMLFLLRLDDASDDLGSRSTLLPYDVTPAYGWYVSISAALLVLGFSLVRPLIGRRRTSEGQDPRQHAPAQQQDAGQPYAAQPYTSQPYGSQSYGSQSHGAQAYAEHQQAAEAYTDQHVAQAYVSQPHTGQSYADPASDARAYAQTYEPQDEEPKPSKKPDIDPGPPPA